jgi:hypothetical protein
MGIGPMQLPIEIQGAESRHGISIFSSSGFCEDADRRQACGLHRVDREASGEIAGIPPHLRIMRRCDTDARSFGKRSVQGVQGPTRARLAITLTLYLLLELDLCPDSTTGQDAAKDKRRRIFEPGADCESVANSALRFAPAADSETRVAAASGASLTIEPGL